MQGAGSHRPVTVRGGRREPAEPGTPYVDGFVIAVPKDMIDEYEKIARDAAAVWREYGALSVFEC
ncbi:MAG: DUF1428 family protein, partial [Thermoleophilaceae bacterium]|nr:DUF1428 family protein [Thermoleophilaceae bacterium]